VRVGEGEQRPSVGAASMASVTKSKRRVKKGSRSGVA
jgi:hypothetical protein